MIVRLDLWVLIPCSEKDLVDKVRDADVPGMEPHGWMKECDDEDHYKVRWHESLFVPSPDDFGNTSFNMLSHKERDALREAILDKEVQERLDMRLKAIWTVVGKQVDIGIWWTVEPDDRDADVALDADQDAYNRIMLSPLEQLATVGQ